jgi:hypothetical protein
MQRTLRALYGKLRRKAKLNRAYPHRLRERVLHMQIKCELRPRLDLGNRKIDGQIEKAKLGV